MLIYLWPVLIQGEVLSPRSVLFQYAPWATTAPPDWYRTTNFILGDVVLSHYPFHVLMREYIHDGIFPSWSGHAYGGVPFFANPQTAVTSPFSLPIWVLPIEFGIGLAAALKLFVAGLGTYLLSRELRLGFWPAMLAGVSFTLSAFSVLWLTHETLLAVAAILPWMLLLVERIAQRGGLGNALLLVLATIMVMTGGHPGAEVHTMFATGIYALVRLGNIPRFEWHERAKRLALIAGAVLLGVLILAFLLIPVWRSGDGTIGVQARVGENPTIPGSELPLGAIKTTIFPDWWGRPSAEQLIAGPANYNERTFFAGSVATIFTLLALISPGAWRRKAPFAVLGFIGLAVPLHFPGLYWLAKHLPLLEQVQSQRMILLYIFCAAILGGFGLQRLIDAPHDRKRPAIVLGLALAVGLFALLSSSLTGTNVSDAFDNLLHLRHAVGTLVTERPDNAGEQIATTVGWWLVAVIAVTILVAAAWRWPKRTGVVLALVVAVAAVDVFYFSHGYQPMAPEASVTPTITPAVDYVQQRSEGWRVAGADGALYNDWSAAMYGITDVRGAEPPFPTTRWFHLWKTLIDARQLDWSQSLMSIPEQPGLNALSVLGVRYLVTEPQIDIRTALPSLRIGYAGNDATVWVNRDAVPRTFVAPAVTLTNGEDETIATIGDGAFRPRRQVVVERSEPGAAALERTSGAGGEARITTDENARVEIAAQLRRPGLVVLNDAIAPGWSVTVDGRPARPLRVNSIMRGVAVGAGEHTVAWTYKVPGLRIGLLLSAIGLLLLAGTTVVWIVLRRRRPMLENSAL